MMKALNSEDQKMDDTDDAKAFFFSLIQEIHHANAWPKVVLGVNSIGDVFGDSTLALLQVPCTAAAWST
jgi:hypothetical protein